MSVTLRKKRASRGSQESYYLDIYEKGKRTYEFLDLRLTKDGVRNREVKRLAEAIRAKRELEIRSGQHELPATWHKTLTFQDYFRSLAIERHKSWRSTMLQIEAFDNAAIPVVRIDRDWLTDFKTFLLSRVSQNTAGTYFAKIKASLKMATERGLIVTNPALHVESIKKRPSKRTYLTLEEMQTLANTATEFTELKRAFLFACYSGLRLCDVKRLRRNQVQEGMLTFRQKKTGGVEYLPLSPVALKLIGSVDRSDELIFKLPADGTLWTHLQIWVRSAGINKHVSFHVGRHTFATMAIQSTKDLYMVSKLLGHTDIKHTQLYAQIIDERKDEAVRSLPLIIL